jgi:hypothetical protein
MEAGSLRRRVAALRQPARSLRIAIALWIVWAIVVWNVVFDRIIVLAGRKYLEAATAAPLSGPYARMDDWMRPAVTRGVWTASAASSAILLVGALGVWVALVRRPLR